MHEDGIGRELHQLPSAALTFGYRTLSRVLTPLYFLNRPYWGPQLFAVALHEPEEQLGDLVEPFASIHVDLRNDVTGRNLRQLELDDGRAEKSLDQASAASSVHPGYTVDSKTT